MLQSSASTSNWDFAPVFNLLRSPTRQNKGQATCDTSSDHPLPLLASHEIRKDDVEWLDTGETSLSGEYLSTPKLGDFGSLWELLGNTSISSDSQSETRSQLEPSQTTNTKPITILKRPVVEGSLSTAESPLQRVIDSTAESKHDAQRSVPAQRRRRRNKTTQEASSPESNPEGESDSCPSVFDLPLSKPQSIPSMIPPQVGISEIRTGLLETPPSSFDESDDFLTSKNVKFSASAGAPRLQPLVYTSAADQRVGLLTKLLKDFPDYAELIAESGRSKPSKKYDISARPIHVFVDMSNIMVGFHDTMKRSRNIPVHTRIRRLPLSFQNFSLILERGRSAAKRVLVGSDRIAAISESEQLGYEANILNRVQKIKQLTPRQVKSRRNPRITYQDGGHSSETNDGPEERWVEQGVDEILHLKILESLLDADEAATIVLATGDAAEAEYSGGFMKMAERALLRGWRVELVSFSQVTSYAYRKKEFRSRWGTPHGSVANINYIAMATLTPQDLYGGAIKAIIPERWIDASSLRQIPDHQELFLSPTSLSNLIFEINERVSEETALSSLQSTPNQEALEILGSNTGATPETVDKAAALYHLNDIRDDDGDSLRIITPPQQVFARQLPRAKVYKGAAQITSTAVPRSRVAPSIGGAVAGSSTDGVVSSVSVHYLLVRLEEQESDVLVFFNVPHKEFDEKGDPRGLLREEELASEVINALVDRLEVADWGLFGG
ncbi:uncharacterized protein BDW70DRAFT_146975 [Aspergillus foveolatus]|uniref:uncharacterized protein n=1 Tax=Aspergillus foveolatus TaxID=210207 RepID=UPI003CCE4F84